MMKLKKDADYYVMYSRANNRKSQKYDGEEYVSEVMPVYNYKGEKMLEPEPWHSDDVPYRVELVRFENVPSEGLRFLFERNPMALLERLPIDRVLAVGKFSLPEDCTEEERMYVDKQITDSGSEVSRQLEQEIKNIISQEIDSPDFQVQPMPVTDVLLYNSDFGDNWKKERGQIL